MAEIARLTGGSDWIELGFVEKEETPRELMAHGIELHLAGLSLAETTAVLEEFGVDRCRTTVHNWVRKPISSRRLAVLRRKSQSTKP